MEDFDIMCLVLNDIKNNNKSFSLEKKYTRKFMEFLVSEEYVKYNPSQLSNVEEYPFYNPANYEFKEKGEKYLDLCDLKEFI